MSMLLADINELKMTLDIDPDNPNENKLLNFLIETTSDWISEFLNRPNLAKKQRTEYYDGTGTRQLVLRNRPLHISPGITVIIDEGGGFGQPSSAFSASSAMTYGTDFIARLDQEDLNLSRSAILIRTNGVWPRKPMRDAGLLTPYLGAAHGIIKVTYTAGYTADMLPADVRLACHLLVARLRAVFPLGVELTSDSYEERSVSVVTNQKTQLMTLVRPLLISHKNWKW